MSLFNGNGVPMTKEILNKGQIQVIFGPVYSGKTTELIRRLKRYSLAKYKCLIIIRCVKDSRSSGSEDSIVSHDGISLSLSATSCSNLYDIFDAANNFDVIGIDEGQFFQDSIVSFAEEMANAGKTVIIAALDATFQRTEFGKILLLIPIAESVVKLSAICKFCCSDASFSKWIADEVQGEMIGSANKYVSVCRECYRYGKPVENL